MYEITIPDRKDLKIEHWFIGEGETLKGGEPLLSYRSGMDFYTFDAPFDGILYKRLVDSGAAFNSDDVIGLFVDFDEIGDLKITDQMTKQDLNLIKSLHLDKKKLKERIHIKATPSARRKAREENIDLRKIPGSGPDGRIQLKDVTNFMVKEREELLKRHQKEEKPTVQYGLPLSSLALRLANKHHLDIQKIPAPPGSMKIRKQDVERYLRNPEGAENEILNSLKPQTTKIALPQVETLTSLQEPVTSSENVIRLTTDEENAIPSEEKIELSTSYKPVYLAGNTYPKLNAPQAETPSVIRLYSGEPTIKSGPVIILPEDTNATLLIGAPQKTDFVLKEKPVKDYPQSPIVRLTGSVRVGKTEDVPKILSLINKSLESFGFKYGLLFMRLSEDKSFYINTQNVEKIKEALNDDSQTAVHPDVPLVIDLLDTRLTSVSGLFDPKGTLVIYLEKAGYEENLNIELEYDSRVLSRKEGIGLINSLLDDLQVKDADDGDSDEL